jgi:hypothetical protein
MIAQAYNSSNNETHPTQPRETAYTRPEQSYQTIPNFGEGAKYTLDADAETKEIIESISVELRNAFVLLAIKNLKNDGIYQSFFKLKNKEEIIEELSPDNSGQEPSSLTSSNLTTSNTQEGPNARQAPQVPNQPQASSTTDAFSAW